MRASSCVGSACSCARSIASCSRSEARARRPGSRDRRLAVGGGALLKRRGGHLGRGRGDGRLGWELVDGQVFIVALAHASRDPREGVLRIGARGAHGRRDVGALLACSVVRR